MVALFTTPERLSRRFDKDSFARNAVTTMAIEAASAAIWREIGAGAGKDFSYQVGAVENYGGPQTPTLRLDRRPVVSISSIEFKDIDNITYRTLTSSEYHLIDPELGKVQSRYWPDTRVLTETPYELVRTGRPLPLITVTYTGGWVTAAQAEGTTLTISAPVDLERACQDQVVAWSTESSRDQMVSARAQRDGSIAFREPLRGLLPEVVQTCKRYRRRKIL